MMVGKFFNYLLRISPLKFAAMLILAPLGVLFAIVALLITGSDITFLACMAGGAVLTLGLRSVLIALARRRITDL